MSYRHRNTRALRNQQLDAKRKRRLAEDAENIARLQASPLLNDQVSDGDGPEASDAPNVDAYPREDGIDGLRMWCAYCADWHHHGGPPGHRVAHCRNPLSPYRENGYVLVRAIGEPPKPVLKSALYFIWRAEERSLRRRYPA